MAHWADAYLDQLESTIANTGWTLQRPSSDNGPLVCTHDDGSELTMVNSTITGNFSIEYTPAEGTRAFKDNPSDPALDNAMEWFEHILQRHEGENYN